MIFYGKSHSIFSNEENHTILPDRNKRPIINHLPLLISPSIFGNGSCDFGPSAFGSLTRGTGPTCEWWGSKLGKTHPNLYPSLYMMHALTALANRCVWQDCVQWAVRQDCIISPVLVRAELGACYQRRTNRAEARVRGRQRGSDQRIGSFLIHVARIEAGLHGGRYTALLHLICFPEFQPTT